MNVQSRQNNICILLLNRSAHNDCNLFGIYLRRNLIHDIIRTSIEQNPILEQRISRLASGGLARDHSCVSDPTYVASRIPFSTYVHAEADDASGKLIYARSDIWWKSVRYRGIRSSAAEGRVAESDSEVLSRVP